ncbi:RNA polymerase factor sigma-54 [Celeribacter litoreus]|uniref:RNA polymerase factor sigma-54 n=1 Tax=Celeribacter litoreus TaxID=2876714 RepID=UPI001CCE36E3|nr:RNA polymerase factor sigma-54 [Celeribacter litoreus]MCA0043365.1 RNA polymerase factor sigma-54 [Celeribacter litoreus]
MQLRHDIGTFTKQTVGITSQVIQSIRILQFSANELEDFLRDQAERNPLMELVSPQVETARPLNTAADASLRERTPEARTRDASSPRSVDRDPGKAGVGRSGSASGSSQTDDNGIERYLAASVSLREHLLHQAAMAFDAGTEAMIAAELIEALDPTGYLGQSVKSIARRLGTEEERVEAVLKRVQGFEPTGVGARGLAECLELQLREKNRFDPAMATLVENLPLLAKYDLKKLARLCGVSLEDLNEMAAEIRDLDPRPGLKFDTAPTPPALPDVLVHRTEGGGYKVELNSELLPRVLVNRQYHAEITAGKLNAKDKRFVADCMKNATWLARNVDQRARTVLNVATEIVAQQDEFLKHGVEHLKPLNLSDVAETVGVHVSTVCRAISNKHLMTDRGLFDMRFFFANSIGSVDGADDVSSETVRHKIAALVNAETVNSVLSDEAIVNALREDGVDIARRTVAKYRDIMNIPSSLQRRRQKKAEALV